jgi:hypothetical protein
MIAKHDQSPRVLFDKSSVDRPGRSQIVVAIEDFLDAFTILLEKLDLHVQTCSCCGIRWDTHWRPGEWTRGASSMRISQRRDGCFANSRTSVSLNRGQ